LAALANAAEANRLAVEQQSALLAASSAEATRAASEGFAFGQFVRIERVSDAPAESKNYDKNLINLAELDVYGLDGQSLKAGSTATSGSTYHGMYPPTLLIDGNYYNFSSTLPAGHPYTNVWMQLNMGSDKGISRVVVTNRSVHRSRAVGLRIRITDSLGQDIYVSSPITTSAASYTFNTTV
jgi:hypothetical protein